MLVEILRPIDVADQPGLFWLPAETRSGPGAARRTVASDPPGLGTEVSRRLFRGDDQVGTPSCSPMAPAICRNGTLVAAGSDGSKERQRPHAFGPRMGAFQQEEQKGPPTLAQYLEALHRRDQSISAWEQFFEANRELPSALTARKSLIGWSAPTALYLITRVIRQSFYPISSIVMVCRSGCSWSGNAGMNHVCWR
jgi:hypothetical protein